MLTNSEQLKTVLESKEQAYEGQFEIKTFGRMDDKKISKIREGAIIKGKKFGPFFVSSKV